MDRARGTIRLSPVTTAVNDIATQLRAVPTLLRAADGATIDLAGGSAGHLLDLARPQVEELLPDFLRTQRWFANKDAAIESARLVELVPISGAATDDVVGHLAMVDVRYADGTASDRYATALAMLPRGSERAAAEGVQELASVTAREGDYVLADAITDREVVAGLVNAMRGGRSTGSPGATIVGGGAAPLEDAMHGLDDLRVTPLSMHSSNTSVRVDGADGRAYALKLVRRHDIEPDPGTPTRALDVWKGSFLTNEAGYANTPAVIGSSEHLGPQGLPRTVTVLQDFLPNDGDGWTDALVRAKRTLALARDGADPAQAASSIDEYGVAARNHGRRLGELHIALSSGPEGSEFRGVLQDPVAVSRRLGGLTEDARHVAEKLRSAGYGDDAAALTERLPKRIDEVERAARELVPIEEIHTHGDFHLGQMLRTGDDVQIIDLEGAPALPIGERWQRTVALGDVARQRSSYEYASTQAIRDAVKADPTLDAAALRPIADQWAETAKDSFLRGWLDATADRRFRHARSELAPELREAEIANAVYETSYELGSRPDWLSIPLERMRRLLDGA